MSINDIFVGQQVCKQAHTHAKLYRTHATVLHLFRPFFVHCTALNKPVPDCKRSSSSSFTPQFHVCLLLCRSALSHTEICQQLDFIVIIAGRLILIVGRIFTGISQTIRYPPSLVVDQNRYAASEACPKSVS